MTVAGLPRNLGLHSSEEQVGNASASVRNWYLGYFDLEFWELSESGNAVARTAAEVSYLRRTLQRFSPGVSIVDLGCGFGDRAIALAQAGFNVTAIDISAEAIAEARRRSDKARTVVQWHLFDATNGGVWPCPAVDAVICMHAFGWGPDFFERRLLRRIHQQLNDGGILVLELSPFWLDRGSFPNSDRDRGVHCSLESNYDPIDGHLRGQMDLFKDGRARSSKYDVRQYSLVELTSLVRSAGFTVGQIDAELSPGRAATASSARTEIVAQRLSLPPVSLAVADWGMPAPAAAEIDLRYAPDEADWLDPRPDELWKELMASMPDQGVGLAGSYPVFDPYGAERGAEVVAQHFQCELSSVQVTFAAGVSAFWAGLVDLADRGWITAPDLVHGDLEAWAAQRGIEVQIVADDDVAGLRTALHTGRSAVLHLDRPDFAGRFLPLDELQELIVYASRIGTTLLIDESAAPYPGPMQSSVRLVNIFDNLVVLRGFTKAYSLGGLRVGFAVASPALAPRIRELVSPLQVGELAFRAALLCLRAGDAFSRLRTRIHQVKPTAMQLLTRSGFDIVDGHPSFPWVAVDNQQGSTEQILTECGIRCLRPASPPHGAKPPRLVRLTIPLSDERMELLDRLLSQMPVRTLQRRTT